MTRQPPAGRPITTPEDAVAALEAGIVVEKDVLDAIRAKEPVLPAMIVLNPAAAAGRLDIHDGERAAHWAVRVNPAVALMALVEPQVRRIADGTGRTLAHAAAEVSMEAALWVIRNAVAAIEKDAAGVSAAEVAVSSWRDVAREFLSRRADLDLPPDVALRARRAAEKKAGWSR